MIPGVVHQNVDGGHIPLHIRNQLAYPLFIRHIAGVALHIGNAFRFIGFQGLFHRGVAGGAECNLRPGTVKGRGNGKAIP